MILKETQVVCKRCNKVLTVANPKGLRTAHCTCGICQSRIEVNFYVEDRIAETSVNVKDDKATSLPTAKGATWQKAFLIVENNEYELAVGNNIVGRWSPTTTADVPLVVNDEFLSRQHVMVNAYRLPDGRLRVTVRNYKNKNETLVNDKPLDGDTVVVNDGDTIRMADTLARVAIRTAERQDAAPGDCGG